MRTTIKSVFIHNIGMKLIPLRLGELLLNAEKHKLVWINHVRLIILA